jgi:signal transduction histidine kinase
MERSAVPPMSERVALPIAGVLLAFLLVAPLVTARRVAESYAELGRMSETRHAIMDLELEIAEIVANAVTPLQNDATRRRLQSSLARADSIAHMLHAMRRDADTLLQAAIDTLLVRFDQTKDGPFVQSGGAPVTVDGALITRDPSGRLTRLLEASRATDSELAENERVALLRVRELQRQGDIVTAALGVATALLALFMAGQSRRMRRVSVQLTKRIESEERAHAEADRAVAQRDQVLRIVSHDLKDPLHTIGMAASLAEDATLPADARRAQLGVIRRAEERMRRLVMDLLDVARLDSGHALAISPERQSLAPLLEEVTQGIAPRAREKHVSLVFQGDVPGDVVADRVRVIQVLSNLIGNAVKFAPPNAAVQLRAEPNGRFTRVSVSNSGPPISPDLIPKLFKPFSQARDTAGLGTGLGLSIAKGIVEAHGGEIGVTSEPGQPTTFWFTLPRATPP